MKNIYKSIALVILAGLLTACLDENPKYSQASNIIFSSEENAELALLGCYGYLTIVNNGSASGYGQFWQEMPILGSGIAWAQRNGGDEDELASLNISSANSFISYAWAGMYKAIAEVNAFIESMEASDLDNVKVQYIGEARFIRALCYYNLVSHWGDCPLKLTASTADGIAMPRTDREEIFAAIIADLEYAMQISPNSNPGRTNSWAAEALLAKVYYKMAMLDIDRSANLATAKEYFDDVYNSGPYALESDYAALFLPYNQAGYAANSAEVIFQLNFNSSSLICYNRASNRFAPQASTSGINWSTYRVAKFIFDLQYGTYTTFDYKTDKSKHTVQTDPRIKTNYLLQWRRRSGNSQADPSPMVGSELFAADSAYTYPYRERYGATDSVVVMAIPYELCADPTNPTQDEIEGITEEYAQEVYGDPELATNLQNLWTNFTTPGSADKWPYFGKLYDQGQVGTASNQNVIVYRYAEFLLLMADVYNELGNTARAIELANEVLARARNSGGAASSQPADWPLGLSQDEVTERLYFERIFELLGEPNIYDLTRIRGTEYLEKLLLKNNNHNMTIEANDLYPDNINAFCDRVFNNGEKDAIDANFLKKNLLLPIPTSEIDANAAISNNDNNFGY